MKTTWNRMSAFIAVTLLLALAGGSALAATTSNWWQGAGNNWNNNASWSSGTAPNATDAYVFFTNQAPAAYTVKLTASATSGVVRVTTDRLTFDMNGYNWRAVPLALGDYYANNPDQSHYFGGVAGETSTVTFSSSAAAIGANGNTADFGSSVYGGLKFGNVTRATSIIIDNSLGFGAKVTLPYDSYVAGANVTVSGPGSILQNSSGVFHGYGGSILVQNGGLLDIYTGYGSTVFAQYTTATPSTTTVNNASLNTYGVAGAIIGYGSKGVMILTNNGVWRSGRNGVALSATRVYTADPYLGDLYMDQSSLFSEGSLLVGVSGGGYNHDTARMQIMNGSTVAITNGTLNVFPETAGYTNRLVLNNSTIRLGGTITNVNYNGTLANGGWMTAGGTITGGGTGNFLLRNTGRLDVGNSPGVLTLNKGNLELAANSKTYFQFSDTALSQVVASNGYASLLGTNLFSLAAGAPNPVPGVKYGLGIYNFVIGTNVTSSPQYDNLVNLLTNSYHLTYSVDFHYGVVNLGGGLFALELAFVPEPSSVLLLALGGLLVWRRVAKRGKAVAK